MSGHSVPRKTQPGVGRFGSRLRDSRFEHRMNQREVAEVLEVPRILLCKWELNRAVPTKEQIGKIAELFGWDDLPVPERAPRKQAPVAVTTGLRKAGFVGTDQELQELVSGTPSVKEILEEESEFSLRRLKRSAQYVVDNVPKLVELYENTLREIHRLEQRMTGGVTAEQVEVLRDKARRWDDLQAIMERKARV